MDNEAIKQWLKNCPVPVIGRVLDAEALWHSCIIADVAYPEGVLVVTTLDAVKDNKRGNS